MITGAGSATRMSGRAMPDPAVAESAQILVMDAEQFGDAACVGEPADGTVRRVAVENL